VDIVGDYEENSESAGASNRIAALRRLSPPRKNKPPLSRDERGLDATNPALLAGIDSAECRPEQLLGFQAGPQLLPASASVAARAVCAFRPLE